MLTDSTQRGRPDADSHNLRRVLPAGLTPGGEGRNSPFSNWCSGLEGPGLGPTRILVQKAQAHSTLGENALVREL